MVKKFLYTWCSKTSLHGFSHIVAPDRHWIERVFWIVMVCISTSLTVAICLDQWNRYKTNPIILDIEKDYQSWRYDPIGVTMCSNYTNMKLNEKLIKRIWELEPTDEKYQYYMDFLLNLSQLRYNNIHTLQRFQNDSTLKQIDLLNTTMELRSRLKADEYMYALVTTEMGVCFTTSKINKYQNPYRDNRKSKLDVTKPVEKCRPIDECQTTVIPLSKDGNHIKIFLHSDRDIMLASNTIRKDMFGKSTIEMNIILNEIVAEEKLKELDVPSRKCRFYDEPTASYFQVYTPNLCRMDCRIKSAIQHCGCKPFFYSVGPGQFCDVDGMICLSKVNWYNATCQCYELCSVVRYSQAQSTVNEYTLFQRSLVVNLVFPKSRISRRVVFSITQLVVAFGGAAGLFLGFSLLNIFEFIAKFLEYIIELIQARSKRTRDKK